MKEVRARADAAYRTVAEQVDALAAVYEGFTASLNTLIERYEQVLAHRKGRAAKKKDEEAAKKDAASSSAEQKE